MVLNLNKFESPLPKDDLCQVWLKLAMQFLRRRFLKGCQCNFTILQLSPLEKHVAPTFEQT